MSTVIGYLNERTNFYTPTSDALAAARSRKSYILKRLYDDHIVHMFETGSLTHGTGLWWHSDVDYFVQFFDDRPMPSTALERIRTSMKALYPSTNIRISRPAVKLDFTNGVKVELVPAYATGEDGVYWIPDPTDSTKWMKSAPKKHLAYVNEAQRKNDNAKKAIRVLKIWKAVKSVPVSSFYLEMRMAKYMSNSSASESVDGAVASVIYDLYKIGMASMQDPTLWGGMFAAASSEGNKTIAVSKALNAAAPALEAFVLRSQGEHEGAILKWKKVLEY